MAKILVIDDDQQCSQLLTLAFEQAGHAVTTANNGNAGLSLACAENFDLIITDVLMPEKDGLELIKELKKKKPAANIIAISGGGLLFAEDCLTMAKAFGARYVMKKPLELKPLLDIASRL